MTNSLDSMKEDLCKWLHYRRDYLDKWKALNIRAVWHAEYQKRLKKYNQNLFWEGFKMTEKTITINYGALGDSIEKQLNDQGFTLSDKKEFIEKLHHSLTMCCFHLLTDSQINSCQMKLHKKIMKLIKPL